LLKSNTTWYVFRHGVTYYSKFGVPYGVNQEKAEILPESIPAITRLAEYLKNKPKPYNFYSSPLLRCRQTSRIVKGITGVDYHSNKQIIEYMEGDESFDEFSLRITHFLEKYSEHESMWVCTHGAGLAAIKSHLTKGKFGLFDLLDYPKPGVLWIFKDGGFEEVSFND
jgi:broad specificity phosphatase PhoE